MKLELDLNGKNFSVRAEGFRSQEELWGFIDLWANPNMIKQTLLNSVQKQEALPAETPVVSEPKTKGKKGKTV